MNENKGNIDFLSMHCVPCEGGESPLTEEQIQKSITETPGWNYNKASKTLQRRFQFKGFGKTMSFINAVAWIINQEGHHPEMHITFDCCDITFTTHAIGGLSTNDFICAAKINALTS